MAQDTRDDLTAGMGSTALLFGDKTKAWVSGGDMGKLMHCWTQLMILHHFAARRVHRESISPCHDNVSAIQDQQDRGIKATAADRKHHTFFQSSAPCSKLARVDVL